MAFFPYLFTAACFAYAEKDAGTNQIEEKSESSIEIWRNMALRDESLII